MTESNLTISVSFSPVMDIPSQFPLWVSTGTQTVFLNLKLKHLLPAWQMSPMMVLSQWLMAKLLWLQIWANLTKLTNPMISVVWESPFKDWWSYVKQHFTDMWLTSFLSVPFASNNLMGLWFYSVVCQKQFWVINDVVKTEAKNQ